MALISSFFNVIKNYSCRRTHFFASWFYILCLALGLYSSSSTAAVHWETGSANAGTLKKHTSYQAACDSTWPSVPDADYKVYATSIGPDGVTCYFEWDTGLTDALGNPIIYKQWSGTRKRGGECPPGFEFNKHLGQCSPAHSGEECLNTGQPIAIASGNKYLIETDFMSTGDFPLSFKRYMKESRLAYLPSTNKENVWSSNYAKYLTKAAIVDGHPTNFVYDAYVLSAADKRPTVILYFPQNDTYQLDTVNKSIVHFSVSPDGSSSPGQVTINYRDGQSELYSAEGQLIRITDKNNLSHSLSYAYDNVTDATTVTVTHTNGSFLTIKREGDGVIPGKLLSMTDPDGNAFTYATHVQNDVLIHTATYPAHPGEQARVKEYHSQFGQAWHPETPSQTDALRGALLKIIENGVTILDYDYQDIQGQAFATGSTFGDKTQGKTLAYQMGSNGHLSQATLTNEKGKDTVYHFDFVNGEQQLTHVEGMASTHCASSDAYYSYDANGYRLTKTDKAGLVTKTIRNAQGRITNEQTGLIWSNGVNSTLQEQTDGSVTETHWNTQFPSPDERTYKIKEDGTWRDLYRENWIYTNNGRIDLYTKTNLETGSPSPAQAITDYSYTYHDPENTLVASIEINGPLNPAQTNGIDDITLLTYNTSGLLEKIRDPFGHETQYSHFLNNGLPQTMTDTNGIVTTLAYHPRGWVETITVLDPSGIPAKHAITQLKYDSRGRLICETSPTGVSTLFTYDHADLLTSTTEGANNCDPQVNTTGNIKTYTRDEAGNISAEQIFAGLDPTTSPLTYQTTQIFDELNRLMDIYGNNNQHSHFDYDANDFLVKTTEKINAVGGERETHYSPDSLSQLAQTTDAENATTAYNYNATGQLRSVTDARFNSTVYDYDAYGNTVSINSPDSGLSEYRYDEAHNLTFVTDARGIQKLLSYDALNRLTEIQYPASSTENVTYFYDHYAMDTGNPDAAEASSYPIGHLTGINSHSQLRYYYDPRGNITKVKESQAAGTLESYYSYRLDDSLASLTYPSGRIVNYYYDQTGQIERITTQVDSASAEQTVIEQAQYQPFGPLTSMIYGNGLSHTREYDLDYQLAEKRTVGSTVLEHAIYTFDEVNNLRLVSDQLSAADSKHYQYDLVDRLTQSQNASAIYDFLYDAVGNRLSKTVNANSQIETETYEYEINSNRIETLNNSQTVDYDAAGNTTADGRSLSLSYNHTNRQSETVFGSLTVSHVHNAAEQRIAKLSSAGNEFYHYDLQGLLLGVYDENLAVKQEYIYLNGEVIALVSSLTQAGQSTTTQITTLPANDGWVRESNATSSVGGTLKKDQSTNKAMRIGDDKNNREYRSVLVFDTSGVPSGVELTSLSLRLKRANGSKVGNPSEDIQAWVLPSGASFVKADFQRSTVALAGQLSAGNTGTVSFSPEAIDAINAQRAAGDTFIKLRLQAAVLTNNNKNDYMGYFTREQTNTDRHPLLTLSYTTGTSQSTPEVFYALNDHLRTTQAIANAQQTIVWRADYSPFGVVTVNEDVDGDGKTLAYNLRFPGQYKDEETGQVYNWHRYYDPYTGRYLTSDPLGLVDGPNTYLYALGNPVRFTDPKGLQSIMGCANPANAAACAAAGGGTTAKAGGRAAARGAASKASSRAKGAAAAAAAAASKSGEEECEDDVDCDEILHDCLEEAGNWAWGNDTAEERKKKLNDCIKKRNPDCIEILSNR